MLTQQANGDSANLLSNDREAKMAWDVFISYASEDRDSLAQPLAVALEQKGLKVWFDQFSLKVGDSLRRSIDRGLAQSAFGVVILSPSFFSKEWPQRELDAILGREVDRGKMLLPIWHDIGHDEIAHFSPMIADRIAINSSRGLESVVSELLKSMTAKPDARFTLEGDDTPTLFGPDE